MERGGRLERSVVSRAVEDDEARGAHPRGRLEGDGERKQRLLFSPDQGRSWRQLAEVVEKAVGLGEAGDRGGCSPTAVVSAERVEDETRRGRGLAEEEKVENAAGTHTVRGQDARAFGVSVSRKREARRVHEDEPARLPGKLQRVPPHRPGAEGVADEIEFLKRESALRARPSPRGGPRVRSRRGIPGRVAPAGAGRVGQDHGAAAPAKKARGVRPVSRVGAETVQQDDRPLRRERPEDECREGRSVVGCEDLAPRAGERQTRLLNRAINGQRIHGDRTEEETEKESHAGQHPKQKPRLLSHRIGTVAGFLEG